MPVDASDWAIVGDVEVGRPAAENPEAPPHYAVPRGV